MASSVKALLPELKAYVYNAMQNVIVPEANRIQRQLEIHPSGFPYCALQTLYSSLQGFPEPKSNTTFASSYFTSVGTLVHEIIQRFMGAGGKVWGHWECSHKECSYKFTEDISVYHDCPLCGNYCDYIEIGFKVDNLDGHMDCLYEDNDGDFWIVDYKTCLLSKAFAHAKDGKTLANNVTYRAQQRAYCTLAHRKYAKSHGIKPKGWILCFIPRDVPFSFTFHGEDVSLDDKKLTWGRICHDIEAHADILDATEYSDIEHLVESKPCKSKSQYMATMANPYSECPLLPVCFSKQLIPTLKAEMDGNVLLPLRKTLMLALKEQKALVTDVIAVQPKEKKGGKQL